MLSKIKINKTIKPFNKTLEIEGDKSLSIRWALLASQAMGVSKSINLLKSEDVMSTLDCLKKLGVKIKLKKKYVKYMGQDLTDINTKKILYSMQATLELLQD